MTPMIDIVFLLIIFFMTLPQLTKVVYHPVELPTVLKIKNDDGREQITINVDQQGTILIGGQVFSLDSTGRKLDDLIKKNRNDPSRIEILIRADGRVKSQAINRLVDLFNQKRIQQVRMSARSQQ